jgi:hypothetical protein
VLFVSEPRGAGNGADAARGVPRSGDVAEPPRGASVIHCGLDRIVGGLAVR